MTGRMKYWFASVFLLFSLSGCSLMKRDKIEYYFCSYFIKEETGLYNFVMEYEVQRDWQLNFVSLTGIDQRISVFTQEAVHPSDYEHNTFIEPRCSTHKYSTSRTMRVDYSHLTEEDMLKLREEFRDIQLTAELSDKENKEVYVVNIKMNLLEPTEYHEKDKIE